ncbi:toll/interleukin-1 receptor domain-containing protein [Streptomyces sp. NPDC002454]
MPKIFVNYRTGDAEITAGLVQRELSRVFGDDNVFFASKSIGSGHRFPQELLTAARRCKVLLAVIGPKWLEARSDDGRPALEEPEDWTRREILEAHETGAVILPLLVGESARLRGEDLPPELGLLAECQYLRLKHRDTTADLSRLIDDLTRLVPDALPAPRVPQGGATPVEEPRREPVDGRPARMRAEVIKHRQRGGIGNLNGDLGTFVSEPQGPVHTGSGHLYQAHEQHLGPRISGDRQAVNYVADNHGTVSQQSEREAPRAAEER